MDIDDGILEGSFVTKNKDRIMGTDEERELRSQEIMSQQQQRMQSQDPFDMAQVMPSQNIPDVPIQQPTSMAEQLLSNDEVPEDLKDKYWWVFHKDLTLGFLDNDRKKMKLLNFDIAKIDDLFCTDYYDFDFEKELETNIMRGTFENKLDRALGIKGANVKNERIIMQSQFSENKQISEFGNNNNGIQRESFFKRLLGRR